MQLRITDFLNTVGAALLCMTDFLNTVGASVAVHDCLPHQEAAHPSLADVMTTDALRTLLDDDDIVARLAEFLPEQQRYGGAYVAPCYCKTCASLYNRTPHDVRAVVACPQFKHQLHVLSMALKTGQLDFAQFGLPPEAQVR